ncbi:hypothetical protein GCM10023346_37950 [Arthrobacter gyeryongensis]|uniref:DUF1508 domain-containing protein n=1 Tax=Arthrobacter gyeryongensis TaxID=1650592 RepID=A0ABP9SME3_9MICC
MRGTFELFHDEDKHFRFRLTGPDGALMALSRAFPDKAAAVAGITAVREYAGTGLITDLCPEVPLHRSSDHPRAATALSAAPAPGRGLPPWGAAESPAGPAQGTRDHRRHKAA